MDDRNPLLRPLQGTISIQNQVNECANIETEIDEAISEHIRNKINKWLKYWGFRHSPKIVILFVTTVLCINLAVDAVTLSKAQYCFYLNICVLLFQLESVILYGFAFFSVNKRFIEIVTYKLAHIDISSSEYKAAVAKYIKTKPYDDDNNPHQFSGHAVQSNSINLNTSLKFKQNTQHKSTSINIYNEYKSTIKQSGTTILLEEALKCILIILPSYISGYLIFFGSNQSNEEWRMYVYVSNILDVIRYAPQILHIALVRSYFQTFPIELQRIRQKLGVIKRKDELSEKDYNEKKYTLTVLHGQFVKSCERVIRPYRILSAKLSGWITVYLLCNIASFTFFILSIVSAMLDRDCQYDELGIYYLHYLVELWTFFAGWVFLVMPYCTNESILGKFFNDVKTMANVSAIEKSAIDCYIDSYSEKSPFSIFSIKPSYGRFMNLLYIVFATITLDIVTKVYGVNV